MLCYEECLHLGVCKLAKYVRNCVAFWEFLHSLQKFYTTTGRNKFQVCMSDVPVAVVVSVSVSVYGVVSVFEFLETVMITHSLIAIECLMIFAVHQ